MRLFSSVAILQFESLTHNLNTLDAGEEWLLNCILIQQMELHMSLESNYRSEGLSVELG